MSQVHLLVGLKPSQLDEISSKLTKLSYRQGETIFYQGDPGSMLYIVVSGQVKIVSTSAEGVEIILAVLTEGDFFGELSLLDQEPRSASAVAMVPVEVLALRRDDFLGFLRSHPSVGGDVLAILSRRLRRTNILVEDAVFLDLPARLAKRLLELGQRHGSNTQKGLEIGLRLSQQDLAAMVGVSRVAVSKQLSQFQAEGLLSIEKQCITILCPEELRKRI